MSDEVKNQVEEALNIVGEVAQEAPAVEAVAELVHLDSVAEVASEVAHVAQEIHQESSLIESLVETIEEVVDVVEELFEEDKPAE